VALLGLLVLVVAGVLGYCFIPPALQESRADQFERAVTEAEGHLNVALAAEDPSVKRQELQEAAALLATAEDLRPEDPRVQELRQRVDAAVTELNAVLTLPELNLITNVSGQVPGGFSSKDLAIGGGGAFLLDREQQRVIGVSLVGGPNPQPVVAFSAGDPVGEDLAGAPQHIAYSDALGGLLVLDDARRLILVRFGEAPRPLVVRDAASWGSADGIAVAQGNLYVLDREGDQVWLYRPTENGFDSEREAVLPSVDLEGATELTVGDAVYLVMADGSIKRFLGGAEQPFTQAGIDVEMVSPASVVPLPESNRVLVADRGNRRIVVFSLEGVFRQQLQSPQFTDLRALAVDAPNNLLYVLVEGALYRTDLPPSPPLP
jgi:hypothetical protein